MTRNSIGRIVAFAILVVACSFAANSVAWCETNSPGSTTPDGIQGFCNTKGGTYFPPGGANGAYGCLWDDMVIICGGNQTGCTQSPITLKLPTGTYPAAGLEVVGTNALMKSQQEIMNKLDDIETKLDALMNTLQ